MVYFSLHFYIYIVTRYNDVFILFMLLFTYTSTLYYLTLTMQHFASIKNDFIVLERQFS